MADTKHSSVMTYVIVALILGVITYIEFALVEYPQAWLGSGWTLFWLITLSIVKFVMVVMFFMHLKDDDRTYTGFFSSGMFIALATFVGLTAMFILPRAVAATKPDNAATSQEAHGEVPESLLENVRTGGASRTPAEIADTPRPTDRSIEITAPQAGNDASTYSVTVPQAAQAASGTEAAGATGAADATQAEAGTPPAEPAATPQPAAASWDPDHGTAVFNANCAACHQMTGQGIPAAFPPLAGHAADIYELDGGPTYLLDTVIFGLQGQITVNGGVYNGVMPAWGHLADGDLADALNHVLTAWGDAPAGFTPYVAADVEARRGDGLSASDVHAHREALGLN